MTKAKDIAIIILAAGKGERMKSALPKVLHVICGRPMFLYTLDLVKRFKAKHIIAVLGHKHKMLKEYLPGGIKVVIQKRLLGTADAVRCTNRFLKASKGTVLVLYADHPLFKEETIRKLIRHHLRNNCDVTLLTAKTHNPAGLSKKIKQTNFRKR
jgi:bifunctional UDP-N-acetylglucosamine pyrophosphorylase/glucosamine-1-phosphate N-acetyltransferase